ncbi:MAG: phosphotransferase [Victivallales bacterium]|nr:phosphotransferase [Victivallales bacterium]
MGLLKLELQNYRPFDAAGWCGVMLAGFSVPEDDLDGWLEQLHARAERQRASRWIASPGEGNPWYVKVLTGASDHDTFFNRLKWRFRPSRALHNWKISLQMHSAGFDAPLIQLAARRRGGFLGWPTDLLVMSPAPGRQLQELLREGNVEELLDAAAAELARFHAAGFVHGDCIPGNLFLQENRRIAFIDNDRTMRAHAWDRTPRIRRNLVQFGFHLLQKHLVPREQVTQFLLKYVRHANWAADKASRELPEIQHWIDRRVTEEHS